MKQIIIILFLILSTGARAQQTISGTITDLKGQPIICANIYFEGSYEGCISDTTGHFSLTTERSGNQLFTASFIGFERYSRLLELRGEDLDIEVVMKAELSEINEVTITAGVFSASDEKKSATLSSFDISTTASALGDIYGAYATMPGSQKVGEEGMLFVRGGESYETKTYMDGMLVQSPYFSSMPNVPTRGRFSPLLFSETLFSTGGYSAEYGHALSSIVDLTTNGLETEDKASVAVMSVGANASWVKRWENSSLAVSGLYANNRLHHKLFKQNVDWTSDPVMGDGMMMHRQKIGESGLLKSFCSFNSMSMAMNYDNFEAGTIDPLDMSNLKLYANSSYSDQLADKWLIRTGIAYSRDNEKIIYAGMPVTTISTGAVYKLALTHLTGENFKTRFGGDFIRSGYSKLFAIDTTFLSETTDLQPSMFLESEWKISNKVALRTGIRTEYSTQLDEFGLLPRVAAAYKTGSFSQISIAWGKYKQKPENDILLFAPTLARERANHYIINYQYRKQGRTFRIEGYVKDYTQLVKYSARYSQFESDYSNDGKGSAQGIDIFWRDSKSLKGSDYWVSYSYLNTSRNYKDYPESTMPHFASAHNLSLVYKRFFSRIRTFGSLCYSFASSRPYDDKNTPEFMDGRTSAYNDISLSLTHITSFLNRECIIHLGFTNLLGFNNVFGYSYAGTPNDSGEYPRQAIVPTVGTQAIIMFMLSL